MVSKAVDRQPLKKLLNQVRVKMSGYPLHHSMDRALSIEKWVLDEIAARGSNIFATLLRSHSKRLKAITADDFFCPNMTCMLKEHLWAIDPMRKIFIMLIS